MKKNENHWKHILLRAAIISGAGIITGYIIYGSSVFVPTMKAFQFTESGVTAGLAYAFFKSSMTRNLWTALFVWYVVLCGLLIEFNWWLLILNLTYIGGITGGILLYNRVVAKPYLNKLFLRIIFAGAIISIANSIIIVVLGIFSLWVVVAHFPVWSDAIWFNMKIGAIIGLAIGIGIELAEYFDGALVEYENNLVDEEESVQRTDQDSKK